MNEEIVLEKLNEIIQDVFDDDSLVITNETVADDVEGWDSLEHITILTAVENTFHFLFPIERISNMRNVGEMVTIILEMGRL